MEPIGEWRADFRTALFISAVTNIARTIWGKKDAPMSIPLEFMPEWDKEEDDKPVEEDEEMFRSWSAHGWVWRRRQTPEQIKEQMLSVGKYLDKKEKEKGNKRKFIKPKPPKRKG